jgi:eukaryotic-like serine/threonine-protein kinase
MQHADHIFGCVNSYVSLQQYSQEIINRLEQDAFSNISNIRSFSTSLGIDNLDAYGVTYTNNEEEGKKVMKLLTVKDGTAYEITYSAEPKKYSEHLKDIQILTNSFETILIYFDDSICLYYTFISFSFCCY